MAPLLAIFSTSAYTQAPPASDPPGLAALAVAPATEPIVLDGRVDESAWSSALPITLTGFRPVAGAMPTEASVVLLTHDAGNLYVAAQFEGSSPADARSSSLTRDRFSGDNSFTLLLDTFGDRESAMMFATNPSGIRVDAAVAGDGQSVNINWNTVWDVATTRTDNGWMLEMRIPFSSLRFNVVDGQVEMGVIVTRFIAKSSETASWPELSPRYANATQRPSLARRINLTGVRASTPMYVTPYALAGATRQEVLSGDRSGFVRSSETPYEVGLDVKYTPNADLALDFTVNTDFAQVEADDQQVNLSRYSLFYPDKRQFFQERAGVFAFNTGNSDRLFHSRRIGLADDGTPLTIYAGARAVGRLGQWEYGLLDMQTAASGDDVTENFGVVRLRRSLWKPGAFVGGMLTTRLGGPNGHNVAYGLDTQLRPFENDYLTMQWAQSFDEQAGSGMGSGMLRALWERRSAQGLVYFLGARWIGEEYRPELGFFSMTNRTNVSGNLRYGWYPGTATIFRSLQPSLLISTVLRNNDGSEETRTINSYLNWELKSGVSGFFWLGIQTEDLLAPLMFGQGVSVPAGRHSFPAWGASFVTANGKPFRLGVFNTFGEFYDGKRTSITVQPTWNASQHLELSASYTYNRIKFGDRNQKLDADIASLRAQIAVDARLSAAAYLQYNRASESIVPNLRVRYHLSEGRDLYVVYNDFINADTERLVATGGPTLPYSQNRALLIKYTHTFVR